MLPFLLERYQPLHQDQQGAVVAVTLEEEPRAHRHWEAHGSDEFLYFIQRHYGAPIATRSNQNSSLVSPAVAKMFTVGGTFCWKVIHTPHGE